MSRTTLSTAQSAISPIGGYDDVDTLREEYRKAMGHYRSICLAWDDCFSPANGNAKHADSLEYQRVLRQCHEDYRQKHCTGPLRTGTSRSSSCYSREGPTRTPLVDLDGRHCTGPLRTGTSRSSSCCSREGPTRTPLVDPDRRVVLYPSSVQFMNWTPYR
jgi:hypothetical protein